MSDTAKTLVLIGGILNLLLAIGMIAAFVVMFGWMLIDPMLMMFALLAGGIFIGLAVLGLLFGILPLMWRDEPGRHRVGLIILGILSIGTIGGLLILIGGIIAEEEKA
ncbi:MAG: hypothetical protein ACFE8O_00295 [Candidatus Hermodarchaeota archaeon]